MIKPVTIHQCVCDICGKNAWESHRCLNCGKDLCEDHLITMSDAVYCTSSDEGRYCQSCHTSLITNPNPLFLAYKRVQELVDFNDAHRRRFEEQRKLAESQVRRERDKLRQKANP